ncbi:MAG: 50S ribosome-binding GTPase [Candidatus Pacearchaeota archaeon]|nr:50S ribosome-binding GTPase [Candidatus Pacearchaeota archaeon]
MTVNAGPEYFAAEKKYLASKNIDEKIFYLQEMIRNAPKHKSSEKFIAELKNRLRRFLEKKEKAKKSGKTTKKTIKKEHTQVVLLGFTNSGKSSLLSKLTNAKPEISPIQFTTKEPIIGTMDYEGIKAQIIDLPSIGSEFFDIGIVNTADIILIVLEKSLDDLDKILPLLSKAYGKQIIAINKSDLLSPEEQRKLNEKIKSKKLNAIIISSETSYNIEQLKQKIFEEMQVIRIYTKEPSKPPSPIPLILPTGSTVKDAAESILKGFSSKIKEARVTGPSSKFPNQIVGLSHVLKDKDIIEFKTK